MNRHEVHVFENGAASIRDNVTGETMHSQIGPHEEARLIYIEQSRLAERLSRPSEEPLVLYDVGMGIASNALAALELATQVGQRPLQIISFENTLAGLELALKNPEKFKAQAKHAEAIRALIRDQHWSSGPISWRLLVGDFMEQSLKPEPEIIFYDFYSPKSCPNLWELRCFKKLFEACSSRRAQNKETVLTTYSAATAVRSALLLAGFQVGYGRSTDLKSETTIASTKKEAIESPLGAAWQERFERSSKALPTDIPKEAAQQAHSSIKKILGTPSATP